MDGFQNYIRRYLLSTYFFKLIAMLILFFSLLGSFLFIVIFIVKFGFNHYYFTIDNLGLIGDYVGGVWGVIISTASLAVTILIAIFLYEGDEKRSDRALKNEEKIVSIQIRHEVFNKFQDDMETSIKSLFMEDYKQPNRYMAVHRAAREQIKVAYGRLVILYPELSKSNYLNSMRSNNNLLDMRDFDETIFQRVQLLGQLLNNYNSFLRELGHWIFTGELPSANEELQEEE